MRKVISATAVTLAFVISTTFGITNPAVAGPYVMSCKAVYGGYSGGYHTIGAWSTVATNAKVFRYRVKLDTGWVHKWHEYKNYSSRFLLPNKNRVTEVQAWQGGFACKPWKRDPGTN